jgi:pyrroline-5-carboxylate reductase
MAQNSNAKKKVAILGAGKMGSILLQSFLRDGLLSPGQTWATVAHPERARMLKEKLKVHAGTDNSEAVKGRGHHFRLREAAGGGGRGAGDSLVLE